MAEQGRLASSAANDFDGSKTQASLAQSGTSSPVAVLSRSIVEHVLEGGTLPAIPAAAAGLRPPIDLEQRGRDSLSPEAMRNMHQGSGSRPLQRSASDTKQVQISSQVRGEEMERVSTPTDATPPLTSSVREVASTIGQQSSEFVATAPVPVLGENEGVSSAAADQRQPCSPGSSVSPKKFGDNSTDVFESAIIRKSAAGQMVVASPPGESSGAQDLTHPVDHHPVRQAFLNLILLEQDGGSTKEMQATALTQSEEGVQAPPVEPSPLQVSSWLEPAAEEPGDQVEDGSGHITGQGGDETGKRRFECCGEQEQETTENKEVNKQKEEEGRMEESSSSEEANRDGQEETVEDAPDEAKEGEITPKGRRTHRISGEDHSSHPLTEDWLSELPTPTGTAAQVSVETPVTEGGQNAIAVAPQQREGSVVTGIGEKHENTLEPILTTLPAEPDKQPATVSGTTGNVVEPLPGTVPHPAPARRVSTVEQAGIGIQAAAGYRRRSSYLPSQAVRPARSPTRASVVTLPIFAEERPASVCSNASSTDATRTSETGAGAEAQTSDYMGQGDRWEEYHMLNPSRQHSTPNLVPMRSRVRERRESLELFESGDSDDSSTSGSSSSSCEDTGATKLEGKKDKFAEDPLSWQQSEEGKNRMAQLTKATVRVETPANTLSRKYLKLFAPSNSVRFWLCFLGLCVRMFPTACTAIYKTEHDFAAQSIYQDLTEY